MGILKFAMHTIILDKIFCPNFRIPKILRRGWRKLWMTHVRVGLKNTDFLKWGYDTWHDTFVSKGESAAPWLYCVCNDVNVSREVMTMAFCRPFCSAWLLVISHERREWVCVYIADSGTGMSPSDWFGASIEVAVSTSVLCWSHLTTFFAVKRLGMFPFPASIDDLTECYYNKARINGRRFSIP